MGGKVPEDFEVQSGLVNTIVAVLGADANGIFVGLVGKHFAQIEGVGLRMIGNLTLCEEFLRAANQFVHRTNSEGCHDLAGLLGHSHHEVDDVVRRSLELGAPLRVCGCDSNGAVVEVALPDINTAHRDHGDGSKVHLLGSQDGGDDHIASGAESAVGAEGDVVAELVHHEDLMGFGDAEFPWKSGVLRT